MFAGSNTLNMSASNVYDNTAGTRSGGLFIGDASQTGTIQTSIIADNVGTALAGQIHEEGCSSVNYLSNTITPLSGSILFSGCATIAGRAPGTNSNPPRFEHFLAVPWRRHFLDACVERGARDDRDDCWISKLESVDRYDRRDPHLVNDLQPDGAEISAATAGRQKSPSLREIFQTPRFCTCAQPRQSCSTSLAFQMRSIMRIWRKAVIAAVMTFIGVFASHASFSPVEVPAEASSVFVIEYNSSVPAAARPAIQAAVDTWASLLFSPIPIRINVEFLGLNNPGQLTFGGPAGIGTLHDFIGAPLPATQYPEALAKALTNHDFYPSVPEIAIVANSNIDWYMGTDGNTGGKYDLRTAMLRGLAQGLGLESSFWPFFPSANWGRPSPLALPWVMDRFVANGSGQVLVNTFANNSVALQNQLFSANLFFNGPSARAANGGLPPKMSAPSVWTIFNQLDFLDESTYPPRQPQCTADAGSEPRRGHSQAGTHCPGHDARYWVDSSAPR